MNDTLLCYSGYGYDIKKYHVNETKTNWTRKTNHTRKIQILFFMIKSNKMNFSLKCNKQC